MRHDSRQSVRMKSFRLGLIVAIALAGLLGSALWVMAQSALPAQEQPAQAQPAEASSIQQIVLFVTATVGTNANACATTTTTQVRANTTVYYCFRVHNMDDESLTVHNLRTSRGLNRVVSLTVASNTTQEVFFATTNFTDATAVDVTNFITWTAQTPSNQQFVATSRAHIDIVNPSVNVVKTVGQDLATCPTTRTTRVPSGQSAAFCISIQNTGDITLTRHTINDQPLSLIATFNYTLAPQQTLNVVQNNLQQLGITGSLQRTGLTSAFANNVTYTGFGVNNIQATGASTATVEIGNTTVRMTKTVSTEPEDCSKSSTITLNPGTRVYYCVIIENTGAVTLTQHQLTENYLSIDVKFDYPLPPRGKLFVTNDFLARANQPIVFGPFEVHPKYGSNDVIENTMSYRGSSPEGFVVTTSAGATVIYPNTPTHTPTDRPDPTSTSTPGPTNTPTFTPIPQTPTPTLTPTFTPVTPSPTPTRSYAISLLQTPTPRSQVAGIPGSPEQQPGQLPTVDPNLPTPFPGQPLPGQDPVLATATQIAIDATTTVVAATTTAIAATATAAQLAIDSAQATALAETQVIVPDSPLPTPTVDPSLPQEGGSSGLPVAPGLETPTALPTETPTATSTLVVITEPAMPGADLTVLPPVVTAVVGSETPGVVVLVVTNTPEAGQLLPAGQRPIDYPTPTHTPDFVMAAARTFDVAVTTFGWLWFLVGSLIFFVTAGVVAGLFFRQSEASRFDLPEPDYWLEEEPTAGDPRTPSPREPRPDDEWPANLP